MCGIAGILDSSDVSRHADALKAMRTALLHRGPDDQGMWRSESGLAALAHARLAIIDLSPAAHQPMRVGHGPYTIVFNGEIYNHATLRQELSQRGAAFSSHSDTEVIVRAFEAYGPECVRRLRGMFAFAIWNEVDRSCFLARDPYGIKPLYLHALGTRLLFASEVRALVASGMVARELDPAGLYGYFRYGAVQEPATLLKGVRVLEAGHWASWREGRLHPAERFWALGFSPRSATRSQAAAATRSALLDSVNHHFVSDVPVGIFLSGGIDSTALVALARVSGRRDLHTFSIALPGHAGDEGAVARRTARHFGTRHAEWSLAGDEARQVFHGFQAAMDQPSIDGFNTFAVAKLAHDHGLKVVLSGIGADELFGGYKSFRMAPRMARVHRALGRHGKALAARWLAGSSRPQWRRLGDMLQESPGVTSAYCAMRSIFPRRDAAALVEAYTGSVPEPEPSVPDAVTGEGDRVSILEATRYMRNQLLRDADVQSMAWGLELRVPYLDAELTRTLEGIPAELRLHRGKRLLLDAVPEVPEWVASRPKQGFVLPFDRWLDDEWRDIFAARQAPATVPTQTWYQKWSIYMLERWRGGLTR